MKSSRSHQEENGLESLNLHSVPHIHPAIQHIWFGYWTFFTIQTPFKVWKQKIDGARSGESNYGLGTQLENIYYLATSSVSMCIVLEKMNTFLQFISSFFFSHIWSTRCRIPNYLSLLKITSFSNIFLIPPPPKKNCGHDHSCCVLVLEFIRSA